MMAENSSANDLVLLGYTQSCDVIKSELREYEPWKLNKIGGCPVFSPNIAKVELDEVVSAKSTIMICSSCGSSIKFLLQLYCPVDAKPDDRVLYVFSCVKPDCKDRKWICLRAMTKPLDTVVASVLDKKVNTDAWLEEQDNWDDDDGQKENAASSEVCAPCGANNVEQVATVYQPRVPEGFGAFIPYYLTVDEEANLASAAGDEDAQKSLDAYTSAKDTKSDGPQESYEKVTLPGTDEVSHKFYKTIAKFPRQLIRYHWTGACLLNKSKVSLPKYNCQTCGSESTFELQLMPGLISFLRAQGGDNSVSIDFGTVLVYSCGSNCNRSTLTAENWLLLDDPDEATISEHIR